MQSTSHGSSHTDRLHHHRARVAAAAKAIEDASHAATATAYDQNAIPGADPPSSPPDEVRLSQTRESSR